MLNWVVYMTAMGTLAVVFLVSVSHKLRDYPRFKASLSAYRLFPQSILPIVAPVVVALEVAAVVAILLPSGPGKWLAFGLLTTYTGALGVNLARGNTSIDCGCGDAPTPISGWLLLRNDRSRVVRCALQEFLVEIQLRVELYFDNCLLRHAENNQRGQIHGIDYGGGIDGRHDLRAEFLHHIPDPCGAKGLFEISVSPGRMGSIEDVFQPDGFAKVDLYCSQSLSECP